MLGKIIKHEFKDTGKLLITLNLILIGITILGAVFLHFDVFSSQGMMAVAVTMMLSYVLGLIALVVVTYIYLAMRFYKSMYGAEGYLTNTLPASTFAKVNGKLLVAVVWTVITTSLMYVSVFSLVFAGVGSVVNDGEMSLVLDELLRVSGYSAPQLIIGGLLSNTVSALAGILIIYVCLAIGQLFNKYKIAAAIVAYVIMYIVRQIVSGITAINTSVDSTATMADTISPLMLHDIIFSLATAVICYIVTVWITHKRLNLE